MQTAGNGPVISQLHAPKANALAVAWQLCSSTSMHPICAGEIV